MKQETKIKLVKEGFESCIEQDFNPDFVHCYGLDCLDIGHDIGLLKGFSLGVISFIAGIKISKIMMHIKKGE